jgi:hypothetical protein
MATDHHLTHLARLVGTWTTEATHPMFPGVVVRGSAEVSWLEGERFLIHRARCDHPDFPDSISIIGNVEHDRVEHPTTPGAKAPVETRLAMHYYDSRGVFRDYDVGIDATAWRIWRNSPGFEQRFVGTFADTGDAISGVWELSKDGGPWNEDLVITYRRR